MSATCPNGHTTTATDYCDVCGAPLGGEATAAATDPAPSAPAEAAGEPTQCPNCGASAPAGALFCENCGYDFTTGTAPSALTLDPPGAGSGSSGSGQQGAGGEGGDPEPEAAESAEPGAGEASDPEADTAALALGAPASTAPVNPAGAQAWVAEIWVDPDWYEEQQPEDPLPAVGAPRIVPLRESSILVGRPSQSRGIHPQVDAGDDTGVSRRQCQLTSDGRRWWVEDLASANGTYIGPIGQPLPDRPIRVAEKRELNEGDRIFIGGWTRIQVREALPGEA